jgi:hypothetical protein
VIKGSKTTEYIIEILSNEWPLTAKQIYNRLKRNYGLSVSYQAIHKHLKQMEKEKILIKNERNLSLNPNWVESKKTFFERLRKSLGKENYEEGRSVFFCCETFIDVAKFVLTEFINLPNPENKPFVSLVYHAWPSIALSDELFKEFIKFHLKTKHYILVAQNTLVDRMVGKTFEQHNGSIKYGVTLPFSPDTLVSGDFIAYIYFNIKGKKIYDQFCRTTKSLKKLNIGQLYNTLFEMPYKHKILLVHNREIADEIRENAIKEFERKKTISKTNSQEKVKRRKRALDYEKHC